MPEAAIAPAPAAAVKPSTPASVTQTPKPASAPAPAKTEPAKPSPATAVTKSPTKPAPGKQTHKAPAPAKVTNNESAHDALDRLAGIQPKKEEPKETKKEPVKAQPKPEDDEPETEPDKEPETPETEPEPEKAPETDPEDPLASTVTKQEPAKKNTPWQIVREREKEIKELKAKLATPQEDPEKKVIKEKFDATQKRLNELEEHIKFLDYEKSTEYQEKYHKPYLQTFENAVKSVKQLKVTDPVSGEQRLATEDDFWAVVRTANDDDAITLAEEMFGQGTRANHVIAQREKVIDATRAAEQAKAEYKTKGSEREKERQEQFQKQADQNLALWNKTKTDYANKYPDYFLPKEGDEEGNKLLEAGIKIADETFTSGKVNPVRDARVRNMAAAFPRLHHRYQSAQAQIKELEAKLSQYENSEPGDGEPAAGSGQPKEKTFHDLVDAAADR